MTDPILSHTEVRRIIGLIGGNTTQHRRAKHPEMHKYEFPSPASCATCVKLATAYHTFCILDQHYTPNLSIPTLKELIA